MAICSKLFCSNLAVGITSYCQTHTKVSVVAPTTPMVVRVMDDVEARRTSNMATRHRSGPAARPPAPAPAPPPHATGSHRRTAPITATPDTRQADLQDRGNRERMRISYGVALAARKTDAEYLKPFIHGVHLITQNPRFAVHLDNQVGWTNASAWGTWMLRAIAPEMAMRPQAAAVRDLLERKSLAAGVAGKIFAERYYFELALYCRAAIDRMDISFIFGQASMVLGPMLGPLLAVPSALAKGAAGAMAGYAAQAAVAGAKLGAEVGAKAGLHAALTDSSTAKALPATFKLDKKYENLDPMRFTLALLEHLTHESIPAKPIELVVGEFGGMSATRNFEEALVLSNL